MEVPVIQIREEEFDAECNGRYQILEVIGRGSYGVVLKCLDRETGNLVAVKRLHRFFQSSADAKRILREVCILSSLSHENVTSIIDLTTYPDFSQFTNLIIVIDLMDTDLGKVIRSGQKLETEHRRYFAYQLLRGLKYIHSANVLHRDLKPSNVLLDANCDLKISDFGLARISSNEPEAPLSEYVTTRWYRAPEILLACDLYDYKIDIWSVGCILAEMVLQRPLFTGQGTLDQLRIIKEIIGSPTEEDMELITNQNARNYMNELPVTEENSLEAILEECDEEERDLIISMLQWDSRKRPSVEDALSHPFLEQLHDPDDEPTREPLDVFEFDKQPVTSTEDVKRYIWEEIRKFHPDFPPAE